MAVWRLVAAQSNMFDCVRGGVSDGCVVTGGSPMKHV